VRAGLGIGLGLGVRLIEQKGLPLSGAPAQPHVAVPRAGEGRVKERVGVRGRARGGDRVGNRIR